KLYLHLRYGFYFGNQRSQGPFRRNPESCQAPRHSSRGRPAGLLTAMAHEFVVDFPRFERRANSTSIKGAGRTECCLTKVAHSLVRRNLWRPRTGWEMTLLEWMMILALLLLPAVFVLTNIQGTAQKTQEARLRDDLFG